MLPDGHVLVVGGSSSSTIVGKTAEIYDFMANSWTTTAALATGRYKHTATLLPNGMVAVAGGTGGTSVELYDPVKDTWTAEGNLAEWRYLHVATMLPNGKLMIVGGWTGSASLASVEVGW